MEDSICSKSVCNLTPHERATQLHSYRLLAAPHDLDKQYVVMLSNIRLLRQMWYSECHCEDAQPLKDIFSFTYSLLICGQTNNQM